MMNDTCIKDLFDQCFHDCPNCPQCKKDEADWDFLREIEEERK